ncbi:MAG TPA: DNA polymerase III subunit alpha, partial [bacterium]|nr:DNA polymerase III subunit alpha [bacterium]
MERNFVHLHTHSEYSLLDGVAKLGNLLDKTVELKMNAIALTDHGNMHGMVKFFTGCKKRDIKPILGCEIYVAPRRMTDKEHPYDRDRFHLLLLVKNEIGYKNLVKIVSEAYTEGFYYRPRADKELLAENAEGIIALSACLGGEVPMMIRRGQPEKAREIAEWHLKTFGEGNYFLELMDHGIEDQSTVNQALIEMSKELSIPLVVTNDVHYINPDDALVQDVMMCVQDGKTLDDTNRLSFETKEFYLKSGEEMSELFGYVPDAVTRTAEIADMCDFDLPLGKIFLPPFDVEAGKTPDEYLSELTHGGLEKRYPQLSSEIRDRADFELNVIKTMGYSEYFLIVWDLIRFARNNGIPVGPGRGSVAGSIVAYALEITQVDPLKYD